ncbi:hypothetical protein NLI96_g10028 [Meripilus lineatus]|uniref:Uncharacterized protein n=1 Tax=Meripilus lineatus TaxID=2056292 RepID=A0AAD5UUI2_9APHY|nr:hypothetical protein NLI96_g10028 [Physisporinus lineatus]
MSRDNPDERYIIHGYGSHPGSGQRIAISHRISYQAFRRSRAHSGVYILNAGEYGNPVHSVFKCGSGSGFDTFTGTHARQLNLEVSRINPSTYLLIPNVLHLPAYRFNWHSAHFGYPNQTQFYHTLLDEPRFLKIFQPNPYRLPDGTWQSFTSNDAEITCHVRSAKKEPFEEALRHKLRVLRVSGNVEIIWS